MNEPGPRFPDFMRESAEEAEEADTEVAGAQFRSDDFEYRVATREGGKRFVVEYRSSDQESWSTWPHRLKSREDAERVIEEEGGRRDG